MQPESDIETPTCAFCGGDIDMSRYRGGSPKRFCSPECRYASWVDERRNLRHEVAKLRKELTEIKEQETNK